MAVKNRLVKNGGMVCEQVPAMALFSLGCALQRLGELFNTPVPRLHPRPIRLKPLGGWQFELRGLLKLPRWFQCSAAIEGCSLQGSSKLKTNWEWR